VNAISWAVQARLPTPKRGRTSAGPGTLAFTLINTFEGGSNNTTVSTSNSGGASGNAFSNVTVGSGATVEFSTADYAHGSVGLEIATGSTSTTAYVQWAVNPAPTYWFRAYCYFTSNPAAALDLVSLLNAATTPRALIVVNTTGTLSGNTNSTTRFTTTSVIPLGEWFRIEGYVTGSPNAGAISLSLFYPDDAQVPVETHTATGINALAQLSAIRFGVGAAAANIGPFWLDDVGVSDTSYLGPSSRTGPASLGCPVRVAQLPAAQFLPRGRVSANPGGPVSNPAPAAGPPFRPAVQAVRAYLPLQPVLAGRKAQKHKGTPVNNPSQGPPFYQAIQAVRARIPQTWAKGRVSASPGGPVSNPAAGPVFRQAPVPARVRVAQTAPRGRCAGSPGGPVVNPVTGIGPVFYPARQAARIRPSLPPRGRAASSPGAPVRNPQAGPVFAQAPRAARAPVPQTWSKGRAAGNPGTVRNPSAGPAFRAASQPARPRILQAWSKGRAAGSQGAPPRDPQAGTPFRQAVQALRARLPVPFLKGRTAGSQGGPVRNPEQGAPVPSWHGAARAQPPAPARGRITGTRAAGITVQPPPAPSPPHGPVQARRPQPSRGRVTSSPGAPPRNPGAGPPIRCRPAPARAPVPAPGPRGRTAGTPGTTLRPFQPVRFTVPAARQQAWTVQCARQLWSVTGARQLWSVPAARNSSSR